MLPSVFSDNARSRGRGGQAVVLYRCGSFCLLLHFSEITGGGVAFCELKSELEGTGDLGDEGLALASV